MIKKGLFVLSLASLVMADTTMCFKKDWFDPSTIETTTLDGGKCAGTKSLADMKKDGWVTEDIKISSGKAGMNFMYVLKKGGSVVLTDGDLESRLNEIQDKREEKKKEEIIKVAKVNGEKLYKETCAKCHGKKGEVEAYNTSKVLNTMSVEDIEVAFRDYGLSAKDNGMAIIMMPYVDKYSSNDIESIAEYIQTLK